jgi:hypothetical protein
MVTVLPSSAEDRGFDPWLGETNDYKIGIYCFSAKYAALRRKNKTGWLGIRIMCPSGATCLSEDCCFISADLISISLKINLYVNVDYFCLPGHLRCFVNRRVKQ